MMAPTLPIVGRNDHTVLELDRHDPERIPAPKELAVVPGAIHMFEPSGSPGEGAPRFPSGSAGISDGGIAATRVKNTFFTRILEIRIDLETQKGPVSRSHIVELGWSSLGPLVALLNGGACDRMNESRYKDTPFFLFGNPVYCVFCLFFM